jgi:hypothetical protein
MLSDPGPPRAAQILSDAEGRNTIPHGELLSKDEEDLRRQKILRLIDCILDRVLAHSEHSSPPSARCRATALISSRPAFSALRPAKPLPHFLPVSQGLGRLFDSSDNAKTKTAAEKTQIWEGNPSLGTVYD